MNLQAPEIILILVVLVLLFGAKKLPDLARGVGRSMRVFKAETSKLRDDDEEPVVTQQTTAQAAPVQPVELPPTAPVLSAEEQARQLEEQAAKLRAQAAAEKKS
ncbi:Sec-independent protein translocase subunit TatA [Nonomuraea sediminis]|uniref:Sec-independent protein translocase subunit TatA n=1 Tax=Nonomuraea sediminis TaxID=2835864 RepID=UPI001BDDC7B9|nr:Sec-independent protein translocase subunit TatA [Nonomuraea sediminis]